MNTNFTDFKEYLIHEFNSRKQKNPRYSLRAFAGFLEIDSSRLSKIFRGKRPIKEKLMKKLGERLGLTPVEIDKFQQSSKPDRKQDHLRKQTNTFYKLYENFPELLNDSFAFTFLELLKLNDFSYNIDWLCKKTGMSEAKIKKTVKSLVQAQILTVKEDGMLIESSHDPLGIHEPKIKNRDTLQKYHLKSFELSLENIHKASPDKNNHMSSIVSTSVQRLDRAKVMINDFNKYLIEYLEQAPEKDTVYQISSYFSPLTKDL